MKRGLEFVQIQRKSSENRQNDENTKYVFSLGPENTESGMSTCAIKNQKCSRTSECEVSGYKKNRSETLLLIFLSTPPTQKKLKISCFVDQKTNQLLEKIMKNNNSSELQL